MLVTKGAVVFIVGVVSIPKSIFPNVEVEVPSLPVTMAPHVNVPIIEYVPAVRGPYNFLLTVSI